jgi:hypothetical protein
VQDQDAHAAQHPLVHALDHRVVDVGVPGVPPPGQHVGVVQHLGRQPVLGLVSSGGADVDGVAQQRAEPTGDGAVHPFRIALGHGRAVAFDVLVVVLAPYGDADR